MRRELCEQRGRTESQVASSTPAPYTGFVPAPRLQGWCRGPRPGLLWCAGFAMAANLEQTASLVLHWSVDHTYIMLQFAGEG